MRFGAPGQGLAHHQTAALGLTQELLALPDDLPDHRIESGTAGHIHCGFGETEDIGRHAPDFGISVLAQSHQATSPGSGFLEVTALRIAAVDDRRMAFA